jgi:hypothetical protein
MSACIVQTPQFRSSPKRLNYKPVLVLQDLNTASVIQVLPPPQLAKAQNLGLLTVPHSLGERVKTRLDFEVKVTWNGSRTYKRLRGVSILISSPNPEQAELFIQAIHDFAASLNGKWLASKPVVDTK